MSNKSRYESITCNNINAEDIANENNNFILLEEFLLKLSFVYYVVL